MGPVADLGDLQARRIWLPAEIWGQITADKIDSSVSGDYGA